VLTAFLEASRDTEPNKPRALDYAAGESGTCNISAIVPCTIIAARLMNLVINIYALLSFARMKISNFHIAHRGQ
jgi:hypothetical protein